MTDVQTAGRLRQQLSSCRQAKGFNRYPPSLRQEAARYARWRRGQGARPSQIASELGVAVTTADTWSGEGDGGTQASGRRRTRRPREANLSLVPVVVRPEPVRRQLSRLEVELCDGTRLQATGISPEDLVRAIEALRGGA